MKGYMKGVKVGWSCDLPQEYRSAYEIVVRDLLKNGRSVKMEE
jgi:hypothetical protein